uniref:Uncharacterized protein n=1 Tax=Anopheles maculatus TaxID=74869 RepID=A0A182T2D8_9DIPT
MHFRTQLDTFGISSSSSSTQISALPIPLVPGSPIIGSDPTDSHTVRSIPGVGTGLGSVGSFVAVNDVIGMNITPALSQVLLAPPATSAGSGASIIAAVNGVADDNGTRSEEINSFYFYELRYGNFSRADENKSCEFVTCVPQWRGACGSVREWRPTR